MPQPSGSTLFSTSVALPGMVSRVLLFIGALCQEKWQECPLSPTLLPAYVHFIWNAPKQEMAVDGQEPRPFHSTGTAEMPALNTLEVVLSLHSWSGKCAAK